jgi:Leucine-rich repeat (LRR) protein
MTMAATLFTAAILEPRTHLELSLPADGEVGFLFDDTTLLGTLPDGTPYYASDDLGFVDSSGTTAVIGGEAVFQVGGQALSRRALLIHDSDRAFEQWSDYVRDYQVAVSVYGDASGTPGDVVVTATLFHGFLEADDQEPFDLPTQRRLCPFRIPLASESWTMGGFRPCGNILISANFPDPNLLAALRTLYPTGLTAEQAAQVRTLNLAGVGFARMDGLHFFSSLEQLDIRNNSIEELAVSTFESLQVLEAANNLIRDLRPLARIANLGTAPNHRIVLDNSRLWAGDCFSLLRLRERAAS